MQYSFPRSLAAATRRLSIVSVVLLVVVAGPAHAFQLVIGGPVGSGEFGRSVFALPNGNFVVTDPGFDAPGPISDVGAVYLFGPEGTLISTLTGSAAGDMVGSGFVVVLANGNYVVRSPSWRNGSSPNAGAVTFGSAATGVSGIVSPANSLVGSTAADQVGSSVTPLRNGNYVVVSLFWDNGASTDAGAATFGSGSSGVSGIISPANSLVGSSSNDVVGNGGIAALTNGNYVVRSVNWDAGVLADVGAATFGSGTSGVAGLISQSNSLVGAAAGDRVGNSGITVLNNGNYLVRSTVWRNGSAAAAGAVTFVSGSSGISGTVSSVNSLVGDTANDQVGAVVNALANGNYVVGSANWDNGAIVDAGAATFGSGVSGVRGSVGPGNSLVGSTAGDQVGSNGVVALTNGNYVVLSSSWNNGTMIFAGAATFGSGVSGISGIITASNSLVGGAAFNRVGLNPAAGLSNGNYVVVSPEWDDAMVSNVGAVTFGSGVSGISGIVSPANSLIGGTSEDRVGESFITTLNNGNYVVGSGNWDDGALVNVGAVTFGSGSTGISGIVSSANSLIGSTANDQVGGLAFGSSVVALATGNYVVGSPGWDNAAVVDAGAATFASGTTGISGIISPGNSLVGNSANDQVGRVMALGNGNYVVRSSLWDNGVATNAGAVTVGSGISGVSGNISSTNSLIGTASNDLVGSVFSSSGIIAFSNGNFGVSSSNWTNAAITAAGAVTLGLGDGSVNGPLTSESSVLGLVANQGTAHAFDYDPTRNQLVVGQRASNRVVLQRTGIQTSVVIIGDTPDPSIADQPVTFTATVAASPNAPADGRVTFTASTGEGCIDTTSTTISATVVEFSCAFVFTVDGQSTVIAEYTGSNIHAYSASAPEPHTTNLFGIFADGFESP